MSVFATFMVCAIGFMMLYVGLTMGYARVYENGITTPDTTWKQGLHREDNYIPFKDIAGLQRNANDRYPHILVHLTGNRVSLKIDEDDFQDPDAFIDASRGRVEFEQELNHNAGVNRNN